MKKKEKNLQQSLEGIFKAAEDSPLTLEKILEMLSGRGKALIALFLSLPFCLPIALPGLSTLLGLAIVIVGLRIAFGHNAWLPARLLKKSISQNALKKAVSKGMWIVKKLQKLTHPRLEIFCNQKIVHGSLIAFLGLFLALPLPIPLTNLLAAWPIFFISLGLLEDDGLFVMLGYAILLICTGAFVTWALIS